MNDADVAVPRNAPSVLRSEGARYPLVDPQGVTFLYQGAADSVGLRCWIHGLPASQPFDRIEGTDDWILRIDLPPNSRIEYKFEVVRGRPGRMDHRPGEPAAGGRSVRRQLGRAGLWLRASGLDPAGHRRARRPDRRARGCDGAARRCRAASASTSRRASGAAAAIRCWSCTTARTSCATRACRSCSTT